MRSIILSLFILLFFLVGIMLYTTCDDSTVARRANQPPVIDEILANPESMLINALCSLQVVASDANGDSLRYQWSANEGTFTSGTQDTTATWQAPGVPGAYTVTVAVSDDDSTVTGNKVLTVTSSTELNVAPTSLTFDAETDTQYVMIENSGTGAMNYQLSKTADWLILSKSSGSLTAQRREGKTAEPAVSSEQITVSVDRVGLPSGVYTDIISVTSDGGAEQIDVTMHVPDGPVLDVSESLLNFGSDQTQMTFDITNTGQGTLNWTTGASEAWITDVTPNSGDCGAGESDQVTVTVSNTGLDEGNYIGSVQITSNAGNATVNVLMAVGEANNAVLLVTPTLLSFNTSRTEMTFNVINTGQAALTWQASKSEAWITGVTPGSGDCNPGEADQVTVTVDRSGLGDGLYSGMVVVTSNAGSDTVNVQMGVGNDNDPVLLVTPQNLNFGLVGTENTFMVTNIGDGTLTWGAGASEAWITSVTPNSGDCGTGESDQVTVTVDRYGLDGGLYSGMVVVNSNAGDDTVNVTMQVDSPAPEPVLSRTPQNLNFGSTLTELTAEITNTGEGTLNWNIEGMESWVTFSPESGSTTTETDVITVTVDRSGLEQGVYADVVDINSNGGNSAFIVGMEVPPQDNSLEEDFSGDLSDWRASYANAWIDNGEAHVIGNTDGYYGTLIYDFASPVSAEYNIQIKMARASSGNVNDSYGLWIQTADTGDVAISYFQFWIRPFDYTNNYYIMVFVSGAFPGGAGWYFIDEDSWGFFSHIKMGINEWNELSMQVKADGRINMRIGDALFYNSDLVSWIRTNMGIYLETEIVAVGLRTTYNFEAKMDEISMETAGSGPQAASRRGVPRIAFPDDTADRVPPLPDDFSKIRRLSDFFPDKKLK